MCESKSLSPKTRGRRVQGVVLSYGIQNPLWSAEHPAFCPTRACRRPPITAHQARLRHYLRPVLSMSPPTHQSKPIAHESCSGSVQYIFSSPAWLRSHFLSAYAYCRHAAELKMLCIIGSWYLWFSDRLSGPLLLLTVATVVRPGHGVQPSLGNKASTG